MHLVGVERPATGSVLHDIVANEVLHTHCWIDIIRHAIRVADMVKKRPSGCSPHPAWKKQISALNAGIVDVSHQRLVAQH
ncbi:hypothetical protein D3C76_1354200 [compost metagenome]